MPVAQRLPFPYRPEAEVVARHLQSISQSLDWAAAARAATPWVQSVRDNPPPFWAMESLLKEYPISSAEGLALMRLAEALLRVPDAETAIALTADQLGRADFDGSGDKVLSRLSSTAIAMSKHFLPDPQTGAGPKAEPGLMAKLGAKTVVAATLRAVQLLGRQFVLGQTMKEAQHEADAARKKSHALRYSYDMLGEGARTDADAQRYLKSYSEAIESIAAHASKTGAIEQNDGISIKLSALHPRFEDAQSHRVLAELVPRVWSLCERAARANINLTIDAEEVERQEGTKAAGLEHQQPCVERLAVVVGRGTEHGDREQEPGEDHQPEGDAVDPEGPGDVGLADPLGAVDELEAGLVGVEGHGHGHGEGAGDRGEEHRHLLGHLGPATRHQRGDHRSQHGGEDHDAEQRDVGRVGGTRSGQDGGEH